MNRPLLILCSLALCAPALAGECSIAVLDLQGVGLPDEQAHIPKILTDTIATEIDQLAEGCRVITQADIAQMLDYEAQKAACGGDSVSCLSDIGGALGVGFVVGGSVGKLGSSFSLQAKYIDINSAEVLRRVEVDVDGEVVQLRAAAKRLAAQLLDKAPRDDEAPVPAAASGGGSPALLWTGVGLVVVGGAAAVAGGLLAAGADGVLNDPGASRADKDDAISSGPLFFFIGVGGAAVAVAGGVLAGIGVME